MEGASFPVPCPAGTIGRSPRLGVEAGCEECAYPQSSTLGSHACTSCVSQHYRMPEQSNTSGLVCEDCMDGAVCPANSTLRTVNVTTGHWRLSARSQDVDECDQAGDWTPCIGGNSAGLLGDGYCALGHDGPLCRLWTTLAGLRGSMSRGWLASKPCEAG